MFIHKVFVCVACIWIYLKKTFIFLGEEERQRTKNRKKNKEHTIRGITPAIFFKGNILGQWNWDCIFFFLLFWLWAFVLESKLIFTISLCHKVTNITENRFDTSKRKIPFMSFQTLCAFSRMYFSMVLTVVKQSDSAWLRSVSNSYSISFTAFQTLF